MQRSVTGKIIGGVIGLFSGGPVGALAGLALGHLVDTKLAATVNAQTQQDFSQDQQVPELFFRTTFLAMGQLAKADGRVSEHEIEAANQIMSTMRLNVTQRKLAIMYFTQGKLGNIDKELNELKAIFATRNNLAVMFVEIQLMMAYADGELSEAELVLLKRTCQMVGVGQVQFAWIHARIKAASNQQRRQEQGSFKSSSQGIEQAYAILGVASDVSDADLKKTYRKLISQHHPDKLLSKGLPEEMMQLAKEKTQQIQSAYDQIKAHRR